MIANIVVLITLPLLCYDKDNNLIGSRMFIVALVLGIIGFAGISDSDQRDCGESGMSPMNLRKK